MKYTSNHILEFLEEWAPQSTKLEYDNVGLLVGDHKQHVRKILACLDVTEDVADEAAAAGADLIIAHHPLIFKKLSRITRSDMTGSLICKLIRNDISLIAAHTNLDAAPGGVSHVMAERLGLQGVQFLKEEIPAGDQGDASVGQNRQPAGFGAIGSFPEPVSVEDFLSFVSDKLKCGGIRHSGSPESIRKVAVCGGAGSFLAEEALRQQADAFVTSDLKYHDFFTETGSFLLVDAGHYETEAHIIGTLCDRLQERFPGIGVLETKVNTNPVSYFFKQ